MSADKKTRSIEIPERVCERIETRLARSKWNESEEYIAHVLREVLSQVERETEDEEFEPVSEDEIKHQLESLGYLEE